MRSSNSLLRTADCGPHPCMGQCGLIADYCGPLLQLNPQPALRVQVLNSQLVPQLVISPLFEVAVGPHLGAVSSQFAAVSPQSGAVSD